MARGPAATAGSIADCCPTVTSLAAMGGGTRQRFQPLVQRKLAICTVAWLWLCVCLLLPSRAELPQGLVETSCQSLQVCIELINASRRLSGLAQAIRLQQRCSKLRNQAQMILKQWLGSCCCLQATKPGVSQACLSCVAAAGASLSGRPGGLAATRRCCMLLAALLFVVDAREIWSSPLTPWD